MIIDKLNEVVDSMVKLGEAVNAMVRFKEAVEGMGQSNCGDTPDENEAG